MKKAKTKSGKVGGRPSIRKQAAVAFVPFAAAISFPRPGGQDCYVNTEPGGDMVFTAWGQVADGSNVVVSLVIDGGQPFPADQVSKPTPTKWVAVFSGITKALNNLTPNVPCCLLVEATDQQNSALRFTHVPPVPPLPPLPAPETLNLTSVTTIGDHNLLIAGMTVNIDLYTLEITAGTHLGDHYVRNLDGSFSAQVKADGSPQSVTISAYNTNHDDSLTISFDFIADFDPPVFDHDPPDKIENAPSVEISGEVTDEGSGFADVSALTYVATGANTGTIPAEAIDFVPEISEDLKTITFTMTIDTSGLADDQYNISFTAGDIAGNLPGVSQPVSFFTPLPPPA